ncbi:hypothetical protein ABK046_47775, partial [Streptomyces caeruleatus]
RLAFDVPADLRDGDIEVVLHGTRFTKDDVPRELIVRLENLGNVEISRTRFDATILRDIRITITADMVAAVDGRIVLSLENPGPLPGV